MIDNLLSIYTLLGGSQYLLDLDSVNAKTLISPMDVELHIGLESSSNELCTSSVKGISCHGLTGGNNISLLHSDRESI